MKVQIGSVVRACAGRDNEDYFVVVDLQKNYCFIANGKSRGLSAPKRKNLKHISLTNSMIELNDDITDKKLRTILKKFSENE